MAPKEKSVVFELLKVIVGGLAGLCIAVVGLRLIFGIDVIERMSKRPAKQEVSSGRSPKEQVSDPIEKFASSSADAGNAGDAPPKTEIITAEKSTPAAQWSYGVGKIDFDSGRLVKFERFPTFRDPNWVDSDNFPRGPWNWASLSAEGGHPSSDPESVVVRRWSSLDGGTCKIHSSVSAIYGKEGSDGIRAYIVSSHGGVLWKENVKEKDEAIDLVDVQVSKGDTIDFCLDCNQSPYRDQFVWKATLALTSSSGESLGAWDSQADYHGPPNGSANDKSQVAADLSPPSTTTPPAEPAATGPSSTEPVTSPPVGAAAARRHPIPNKEEQDRLRAEIGNLLELEKAKSVADHLALAKRLREIAADAKSKPNERFVLLRTAYDEAIAGRDFAQAFEIVEELAGEYEFDGQLAIRETLLKLVSSAKSQAAWELVEFRTNELLTWRERSEDFAGAMALMQSVAAELQNCPNPELRQRLQRQANRAAFIHDAWQAANKGKAVLKDSPMDPAAHLALARWQAFVLGDWEGSLEHFAASGDEQIRKLAELEKKPPATAEEMEACGEAWLAAAKSRDDLRPGVERATYWYDRAFLGATGLLKIRVDKRIRDIQGDYALISNIIKKVPFITTDHIKEELRGLIDANKRWRIVFSNGVVYDRIVFHDDGTWAARGGDKDFSGTWTYQEDRLVLQHADKVRWEFIQDRGGEIVVRHEFPKGTFVTEGRATDGGGREPSASIKNSLGVDLVLIPAGQFRMGAGDEVTDDAVNKPQHLVRIARPFYLGKYEVTRSQFAAFIKESDYRTDGERDGQGCHGWNESAEAFEGRMSKYSWRETGFPCTDDCPVVNVSWNDAIAFCHWLSEKEHKKYRLPTEAEWEYACRAGTNTAFSSGNDSESLATVGNVPDTLAKEKFTDCKSIAASDGFTFLAPVGKFRPNAFGIHDMHGNAWEWCADWSGRYAAGEQVDPQGPSAGGSRVFRGGAFDGDWRSCGSAYRDGYPPTTRFWNLGFRVVMETDDAPK